MIKCEVIGNLGADVEVKEVNGRKFATCRVAHTEKFQKADGAEVSNTVWIDVIVNDAESKVLQYLKAGTKVFVRGNASLRVYSSAKDRCMKAGLTISAYEIELCGGNSDPVPHKVIDPADGRIYEVKKYFWIGKETKGMKKDDIVMMVDARGRQYGMNAVGFVEPVPGEYQQQEGEK